VILVDAADLTVSRPGKPLFDGLSVTVASGDRVGVVGVNGSGKSTLLGVLAGTVDPEQGTVRRGRGARVTFLDQSSPLPEGKVRDVAGGTYQSDAILDRLVHNAHRLVLKGPSRRKPKDEGRPPSMLRRTSMRQLFPPLRIAL
jgi:ATPase subunit of ABC transporter with duplicated ATPase domains